MSVARKDDRHSGDLVDEIADGFTRALEQKRVAEEDEPHTAKPRFVITGDKRAAVPKNRRAR